MHWPSALGLQMLHRRLESGVRRGHHHADDTQTFLQTVLGLTSATGLSGLLAQPIRGRLGSEKHVQQIHDPLDWKALALSLRIGLGLYVR